MPMPKPDITTMRLAICATHGGWHRRRLHELLNKWHAMAKDEQDKALAAVKGWSDDERRLLEKKLPSLESLEPKGAKPAVAEKAAPATDREAKPAPPAKAPAAK